MWPDQKRIQSSRLSGLCWMLPVDRRPTPAGLLFPTVPCTTGVWTPENLISKTPSPAGFCKGCTDGKHSHEIRRHEGGSYSLLLAAAAARVWALGFLPSFSIGSAHVRECCFLGSEFWHFPLFTLSALWSVMPSWSYLSLSISPSIFCFFKSNTFDTHSLCWIPLFEMPSFISLLLMRQFYLKAKSRKD